MTELTDIKPYDGDPIKRFEFVKHIKTGGFGDVILCKDQDYDNNLVIIKLAQYTDKTTINEINMLYHIRHKYIVRFFDFFKLIVDQSLITEYELSKFSVNQQAYGIIIEFGVGGDLMSYIENRPSIEESILIKITSQVTQALLYLNENRTMHRDIKPENILLDKYGDIKLTDFGTGDVIAIDETHRVFTQQTGTLLYMAPEIRLAQKSYNYNVDIYSLGISLYRACKCEISNDQLINIVVDGKTEFPEPISEDQYAPEFVELINKMVAYDPKDRCDLADIKETLLRIVSISKLSESQKTLLDNSINMFYGIDGVVKRTEAVINFDKLIKCSDHPEPAFQLAQCYLYGCNVKKDEKRAIELLRIAARKLHSPALKLLAFCYQYGIGVEKDLFTAIQLLTISQKNNNDDEASFLLGYIYYNAPKIDIKDKIDSKETVRQDYELAFHYFLKANDFVPAHNYLGLCYLNGNGVEEDPFEAYKYFSSAVKNGSIDAMYNLANFYLSQKPGNKNYTEKAIKLLNEAASKYHMSAAFKLSEIYSKEKDEKKASLFSKINSIGPNQYDSIYDYVLLKQKGNIEEIKKKSFEAFSLFSFFSKNHSGAAYQAAKCYRDGNGTNIDIEKAAELFEQTSNNGILDAQVDFALCLLNGEGRPADKEKAVNLLVDSSNLGSLYATTSLAECYLNGNGVKEDKEQAVSLLRKAHSLGFANATYLLAECLQNSGGNSREARKLFEIAALKGHAASSYKYGLIFLNGIDVYIDKQKAFAFFEIASMQNHPQATTELGKLYKLGVETMPNPEKAFELFQKAANLGNVEGVYHLAMCYLNGFGVETNKEKARCLLERASEDGFAKAKTQLGILYQKGIGGPSDPIRAAELFEKAIKLNDSDAKVQLGKCYLNGIGIKIDPMKAFSIFKETYKQDENCEGTFQLAKLYMEGRGTHRNLSEAFLLFKWLATKKHYVPAICELGICYIEGFGTNEEIEKGISLLTKAADKGNSKAMNLLGVCYLRGKSKGIEEDIELAIDYFKKATEAGNVLGKINLAQCYIEGKGVAMNLEKGYKLLQEEHEDPAAKFRIGVCLYKGIGVKCDKKEGLRLLQEAAYQNDLNAMCYYGKLMMKKKEKEVRHNKEVARELFEKAAKQGHPESMYQLGLILEEEDESNSEQDFGLNKIRALNYFKEASMAGFSNASYHLGMIYMNDENRINEGIELLKKAANANHISSLEKLVDIYKNGIGVKANHELSDIYQSRVEKLYCYPTSDMTSSSFSPNMKFALKGGFFGLLQKHPRRL